MDFKASLKPPKLTQNFNPSTQIAQGSEDLEQRSFRLAGLPNLRPKVSPLNPSAFGNVGLLKPLKDVWIRFWKFFARRAMDTEACGEFLEMMPEGKPAQVSLPNRKNMQRFFGPIYIRGGEAKNMGGRLALHDDSEKTNPADADV